MFKRLYNVVYQFLHNLHWYSYTYIVIYGDFFYLGNLTCFYNLLLISNILPNILHMGYTHIPQIGYKTTSE